MAASGAFEVPVWNFGSHKMLSPIENELESSHVMLKVCPSAQVSFWNKARHA